MHQIGMTSSAPLAAAPPPAVQAASSTDQSSHATILPTCQACGSTGIEMHGTVNRLTRVLCVACGADQGRWCDVLSTLHRRLGIR